MSSADTSLARNASRRSPARRIRHRFAWRKRDDAATYAIETRLATAERVISLAELTTVYEDLLYEAAQPPAALGVYDEILRRMVPNLVATTHRRIGWSHYVAWRLARRFDAVAERLSA